MVETRGFSFTPSAARPGATASPVPLSFVDGASLVPDIGISEWARGAQQATSNLLSGVQIGIESLTKGAIGLAEIKRSQAEKEEERAYKEEQDQRDFEQAKIIAGIRADRPLTALQEAQLEGTGLRNRILEEKLQDPYADYLGPADEGLDVMPEEQDILRGPDLANVEPPLPRVLPAAPLAPETEKQKPDTYTAGNGMLIITKIPKEAGGGRVIINRATGTSVIDKDTPEAPSTLTELPKEVKDNLRLKGVSINSKGEISTTYEPPAAPGAELSADQLRVVNTLSDNYKQDAYASAAGDAIRSVSIVRQSLAQKNGFGDIAAINAFQRMVDPGVAVREGDVALIQSAIAKYDQLNPSFLLKRLESGDKLDDRTRQRMLELAQEIADVRARAANESSVPKFRGMAQKAGVDPDLVASEFPVSPRASLDAQITALAEQLDGMDDKTSPEFQQGREQLKKLVRERNALR